MDDVPRGLRLLELNPALALPALCAAFAQDRRLQVRDVLTDASARTLHRILAHETPWGLSWQAGAPGPRRADDGRHAGPRLRVRLLELSTGRGLPRPLGARRAA